MFTGSLLYKEVTQFLPSREKDMSFSGIENSSFLNHLIVQNRQKLHDRNITRIKLTKSNFPLR